MTWCCVSARFRLNHFVTWCCVSARFRLNHFVTWCCVSARFRRELEAGTVTGPVRPGGGRAGDNGSRIGGEDRADGERGRPAGRVHGDGRGEGVALIPG